MLRASIRRLRRSRGSKRPGSRRLRFETLASRRLLAGDFLLTEFMAANGDTLRDEDGQTSDWVEVHNPAAAEASLAGWYLTDDPNELTKWEFPDVTIAGDGYLVVFASNKDRRDAARPLHTDFKLSAGGEYVALVSPGGTVVSEFGPGGTEYPPQRTDVSYGSSAAGAVYFTAPTPGAVNGEGVFGFVAETAFSAERGFYDTPFALALSSPTQEVTIRYTTDGSRPTATYGTVYTAPITLRSTSTLRAAAFKDGYAPSPVATNTYLFLDDVLRQSETFGKDGEGLPPFPSWGHTRQSGDWEVDPDVVNSPSLENRLTPDDLKAIPTISLVLPWQDMFGADGQGIYIQGDGVPRAVSVEQILGDGTTGFQIDASVQIQGGSSARRWKADKLSMRLKFTEPYGPTKLDTSIFGPEATERFDTIILDAVLNHSWHIPEPSAARTAKFIQDQYVADLQNAMGGTAPHARFQHLYINGLYWGMYYVHERPDESFAAAYLGGDKEDYDVIKHRPSGVVNGTNENYLALLDLARQDLSVDANYDKLTAMLDIDDFIDYMLANFYTGNDDWGNHNWYASFNRVDPAGRWRYHSWDAEIVLNSVRQNVTIKNNTGGPTEIHQRLAQNAEYRLRFADHVQNRLFNGGVLTPARAAAQYQDLMDEVDQAIRGESARWGDNQRDVPYTREDWLRTQRDLLTDYFPVRTGIVLNQLKARDLFPDVEPPIFNRRGGDVSISFDIELSAAEGVAYYTTDGSDPRLPGGAVAPTAIRFEDPFRIAADTTVQARTLRDGRWSALDAADFVAISDLPLRVSEINYRPYRANPVPGLGELDVERDRFEFIELANVGRSSIDLAGIRLVKTAVDGDNQGIAFTFATQALDAGARLVVVRDRAAFASRYGMAVRVAAGTDGNGGAEGEFGGRLADLGERLTLVDSAGRRIQQFDYLAGTGWPERADGMASTLEIIDPVGDYNAAANWRASSEFGGSPGAAGAGPDGRIIINEVLPQADSPDADDRIELYNGTDEAIDIGGWYLSDSATDFFQFRLPAPMVLPEGAYVAVEQALFGFDLDGTAGDELWLVEADTTGRPLRLVDHGRFAASAAGVSLGRWPDGDPASVLFPMQSPTFGAANSRPAVGDVIVSEIYFNPPKLGRVEQDFNAGRADPFAPVQGQWAVDQAGRYLAVPEPDEGANPITLLRGGLESLPNQLRISAALKIVVITPYNRNGLIIFDYRGPDDFKFASVHFKKNSFRIGQRDADGWHFLTKVTVPIPIFQLGIKGLQIAVEIRGSQADLLLDGFSKVSYDFGVPLAGGQIGLGTKNGEMMFDDVLIEPLAEREDFQFVELVNTTGAARDLAGWRLTGAVDWTFAAETTLAPGASLVLVGFDPARSAMADDFRTAMDIEPAVPLVGPFLGDLSTAGGTIELVRPVGAGMALVDRASYDRGSPGSAAADGTGRSIHRRTADAFGVFPTSWAAARPSPGETIFARLGDLNLDGRIAQDDIDGLVLALRNPAAYRATYGAAPTLAGDVDLDGDVDFDDINLFVALLTSQDAARAAPARVTDGGIWGQVARGDSISTTVSNRQRAPRIMQRMGVRLPE